MKNGVKRSLIPILINYFQNREMVVKWHGTISTKRKLNGGGPQGGLWGIIEYLSQSNNNTDFIPPDKKFKFIDDLSILEIVNLLSIGLSSYNFSNNVASDIPVNGYFLHPRNLKSQNYVDQISAWTKLNKMQLNKEKSKTMIFNFTKNFQFSTRISIENVITEEIRETKLLGVMLNNQLDWNTNTTQLVRKANARMRILHRIAEFGVPREDLKNNIHTLCQVTS